jgi:hypothetical protein
MRLRAGAHGSIALRNVQPSGFAGRTQVGCKHAQSLLLSAGRSDATVRNARIIKVVR